LQLALTLEAAGYKPQARREFERVAQSKQQDIAKQAKEALAKYVAEDKKIEQVRLQNLRAACGTMLSDYIANGKLDARDLYFVQQHKLGNAMSFDQPNISPFDAAPVKPAPEREKWLRQLAISFQPLQKSATPAVSIRPGDVIVNFAPPQRYGTVAVVQNVDSSKAEMMLNTLSFDENQSAAGIGKASVPLKRVKNEDSYFVLRPLDTKFLSVLAQGVR
jgi:hypothetical protein